MDRLSLPPLKSVIRFEGKGNYAVKKYYTFPFSIFYRHKLKMVLRMLDRKRIYKTILDFGGGEPQIFNKSLRHRANHVHIADRKEEINTAVKYDVIVCASILEFVWLKTTLPVLKMVLKPNGMVLVASPMDTWLTRAYFRFINDYTHRNPHEEIIETLTKHFNIVEYKTWFGLYFACKAMPK